jgi:hypothetical protein
MHTVQYNTSVKSLRPVVTERLTCAFDGPPCSHARLQVWTYPPSYCLRCNLYDLEQVDDLHVVKSNLGVQYTHTHAHAHVHNRQLNCQHKYNYNTNTNVSTNTHTSTSTNTHTPTLPSPCTTITTLHTHMHP